MPATFPAYQNMISFQSPEELRQQTARYCRIFNCPPTDVSLSIELIPETDIAFRQGFRTQYRMEWTSYLGWRVYMLSTGCFASDPRFE